ncbi:unnamed protein product [Caenorhabditis auriculariae]|uniref:Uncharacterized protein n=1 Tax=Caenorhabditis auriculariae TaxID=2777116 RepID=A0A8S1H698_9PELO|nr:unnamed protein product [Caenorhabditis auriculariae]
MGNVTANPTPEFYEEPLRIALILEYIFINLLIITSDSLFLIGIRKLWGWKSNFAYVILGLSALSSLQASVVWILALLCALIRAPWEVQILWRIFGAFQFASDTTNVIFFLFLLGQQFCYTALPSLSRKDYCTVVSKIVLAFLVLLFFFQMSLSLTPWVGNRFVPGVLSYASIKQLPFSKTYISYMNVTNDITTYLQAAIYLLIFLILTVRKNISWKKDKELRMLYQETTSGNSRIFRHREEIATSSKRCHSAFDTEQHKYSVKKGKQLHYRILDFSSNLHFCH